MRILTAVVLLLLLSSGTSVSVAEPANAGDSEPRQQTPVEKAPAQTEKTPARNSLVFRSLAQMNELMESDMPALALSLLEAEQKKYPVFSPDWYAFEYKRIMLMSALEQWPGIISRTQWLFDTADADRQITRKIHLWFETQQVMARLQLQQSGQALAQLQRLIWLSDSRDRGQAMLPLWRQLVIRAYLQLQYDDDARRALLKYSHDYPQDDSDIDWLILQARVFMRTGRPALAASLLQNLEADDAVALSLLAGLQARPETAADVYRQMRDKLDGRLLGTGARWLYACVAYQAAVILNDLPAQITDLEAMLSLRLRNMPSDAICQVDADTLWELYRRRGEQVANEHGLLIGSLEQWQQLNKKLLQTSSEQALALAAALALHLQDAQALALLHRQVVEILQARKNGLELIYRLYLKSRRGSTVTVLPETVRYQLVDYAITVGDYSAAVGIMQSLPEPPQGKNLFDWRMRKARLLILRGEYAQSEELIRKTFAEKKTITPAELDRYIQVVFDFQTVQQHQRALRLFDLISMQGLDEKLRRELFFWKADSYSAMKQHDYAAMFYLKSANAVTGGAYDLWGQSARYKAARSLIEAGIYDDAERVLRKLLKVTVSESRKVMIRQLMQKIQLLETVSKTQ